MTVDLQETLTGLFTEIAILEHLTRTRVEKHYEDGQTPWHFGILNYFVRNHPGPDTVSGIAWAFQDPDEVVAERVREMAARGWLTVETAQPDADSIVAISEGGRQHHREQLEVIAPDFLELVSEIPPERLAEAHDVLREIRLTMDNLPDR